MMAASTPPNASAKACSFPASDGWVALTEGIRPTNLFPATAGATTRIERLGTEVDGQSDISSRAWSHTACCSYDDDKDGFDILLSGAGQSSSPSTVTSGRCGNKDDSTSPTSSPSRHIRFVDATIRAVRPAEAPVSVDTLGFSRKPTLPRLRTSMVDCSSSLSPMERYLNTEGPSPSASVNELARDSKRWSTEQGQPDTIRDYAGELPMSLTCSSQPTSSHCLNPSSHSGDAKLLKAGRFTREEVHHSMWDRRHRQKVLSKAVIQVEAAPTLPVKGEQVLWVSEAFQEYLEAKIVIVMIVWECSTCVFPPISNKRQYYHAWTVELYQPAN